MDPYFLRHNERIKTAATVLTNLGAAALGYGIAKISDGSQDFLSVCSVIGAMVLFYGGYAVLEELETEA